MSDSKDHASTNHEEQLRAELGFDQQIDDLYAQMGKAEPPSELDAAILAAAQIRRQENPPAAGHEPADGQQTEKTARHWSNRGLSALASAAVLLLSVGIFLKQSEVTPQLRTDEVMPMAAPVSAADRDTSTFKSTKPQPAPAAVRRERSVPLAEAPLAEAAMAQSASAEPRMRTLAAEQVPQPPQCVDIKVGLCRDDDARIHFKATDCDTSFALPFRSIEVAQLRVDTNWIEYVQPGESTRRKAVCSEGSWTQTETSP